MQFKSLSGFLFLLISLTACASQSSNEEIKKELTTVKSWTATVHMVGDAWMRGAVPTPYAKDTLKKAQQEFKKEADTLSKKQPMQQQKMLLGNIHNIESTVEQMSTAVEQKDRTALAKLVAEIAQEIQQLSAQEQKLTALAKTAGEQP
jgi:hypothetical protein